MLNVFRRFLKSQMVPGEEEQCSPHAEACSATICKFYIVVLEHFCIRIFLAYLQYFCLILVFLSYFKYFCLEYIVLFQVFMYVIISSIFFLFQGFLFYFEHLCLTSRILVLFRVFLFYFEYFCHISTMFVLF